MKKEKIPVLVSGLPGKMAMLVFERLFSSETYRAVPYSLTGEDTKEDRMEIDSLGGFILLIKPSKRYSYVEVLKDTYIGTLKKTYPNLVAVDYSHASAVNANAEFFCKHDIPFVMGTTDGDRTLLKETIENSNIPAVVSPNMSIPIVLMMSMFDYAAKTFPDALKDYFLLIEESHQASKSGTSGTAKDIGANLGKLGALYLEEAIRKIRDRLEQIVKMGIPAEFVDGHGYHEYQLLSPDGTIDLGFMHNVRGRKTYIDGTMTALDYLVSKVKKGEKGYFDMTDVMRQK